MTHAPPRPEPDSRAARERAFHDELIGTQARERVDRYYGGALAGPREYRAALASVVGSAGARARVLEYGCGAGSAAFELAEQGHEVLGIDISPAAIGRATDTARTRGLSDATFRVMDAHALDVPDGSFDVVCGSGILHHLDVDRALAEVARVLRPQGRAVFFEPLGHNPLVNLYRRATPDLRTVDESPLRWSTIESATRRFARVDVRACNLVALVLTPVNDRTFARRLAPALHATDRALFRALPCLRRYAWTAVITLSRSA
jgi:SAM-dependent methyltransferase